MHPYAAGLNMISVNISSGTSFLASIIFKQPFNSLHSTGIFFTGSVCEAAYTNKLNEQAASTIRRMADFLIGIIDSFGVGRK